MGGDPELVVNPANGLAVDGCIVIFSATVVVVVLPMLPADRAPTVVL